VVVYFYPKDETSGCTVEAEGIRDSWQTLQVFDIEVFGVSVQDAASHQAFIDKHQLPFPLVVDGDHTVLKSFGVPLRGDVAARQTFLIAPDGVISKIWREVDPKVHAQEIVDAIANH
jgi:peroxiredoxin Q/BCP